MIYPYVELPNDPAGWPRPVLDVVVGHMGEVLMPCLADTGAMNTIMPGWVADLAGIDLVGAPSRRLGIGGTATVARLVPTMLSIDEYSWEAEVAFCDPWPRGWGLLGQTSFFRFFEVTFRAADLELELQPLSR